MSSLNPNKIAKNGLVAGHIEKIRIGLCTMLKNIIQIPPPTKSYHDDN